MTAIAFGLVSILGTALAQGISLDRLPDSDIIAVVVPDESRPEIGRRVPIPGPWRLIYGISGVRTWEAPLPVRPRTLFFHHAPGDMTVFSGNRRLRHRHDRKNAHLPHTWSFTNTSLQVRRPIESGPPGPDEYTMQYKLATKREQSLNYAHGPSMSRRAFVKRSVQVGHTTRHGLLLPAPAMFKARVALSEISSSPDAALVLDMTTLLVPPEVTDPDHSSNGAKVIVNINGQRVFYDRITHEPQDHRIDLSAWAGQDIDVTIETDPDGESVMDYVFVADPVIHIPQEDPNRVIIIFIDTLRPDHMSLYGYGRPTTPALDDWSQQAAVFEQARSIAPWTLPSARTMVTGAVPERWKTVPTLQNQLAQEGWATGFICGNIYLSSNFEMADDWGEHHCSNWPLANVQVNRAIEFLDRNEDRPAFLILHFMDMHLPYTEPASYRRLFAGDTPESFNNDEFSRSTVIRASQRMGESGKQYIRDRYDNNLRFIDDELARFLADTDDDDLIIILSDHGEEFWDHSEFEHGHSLYDELLRVPLIVRGPGFPEGRFQEPTSLLDVAPTIAEHTHVDASHMEGLSLQSLVSGHAQAEFSDRPQAFGRQLYGSTLWGSLLDQQKYISTQGHERLYDLSEDPTEQHSMPFDLDGLSVARQAMADALDTEVKAVLRLTVHRNSGGTRVSSRLIVPGGVAHAWVASDPTNKSQATVESTDDTVSITWSGQTRDAREIYVLPIQPVEEIAESLTLIVESGGQEADGHLVDPDPPSVADNEDPMISWPFLRGSVNGKTISVSTAIVPIPAVTQTVLDATNIENCAELEALGYLEPGSCQNQ